MIEPLITLLAALLGFLTAFLAARGEILRLRDQNADLLGCLYNRIGYSPVKRTSEIAPVIESGRVVREDPFPDLLTLQERARND